MHLVDLLLRVFCALTGLVQGFGPRVEVFHDGEWGLLKALAVAGMYDYIVKGLELEERTKCTAKFHLAEQPKKRR